MKRYILLIAFILTAFTFGVSAQESDYRGKAKIVIDEIEKRGDSLVVRMVVDIDGRLTDRNESLILTPYIQETGGNRYINLPEIVINGKVNQKLHRRTLAMDRTSHSKMSGKTVVGTEKNSSSSLFYRVSTPYSSWMDNSILNLQEEILGCAGTRSIISVNTLASFTYEQPVPPPVIVPEPPRSTVVEFKKEGTAYIDFEVAKYNLLPDFRNNRQELGKIEETIRSIIEDEDAEVTGIYLTGFASPEGTYEYNQRLSMNRAEAVRTYLLNKYPYSLDMYHTSWGGEDWNELRKLVEESDTPQKSTIIDIIDNVDIFAGREKRLMNLEGGAPYRYMLQNFFPQLRRVHYSVTYEYKDEITVE